MDCCYGPRCGLGILIQVPWLQLAVLALVTWEGLDVGIRTGHGSAAVLYGGIWELNQNWEILAHFTS